MMPVERTVGPGAVRAALLALSGGALVGALLVPASLAGQAPAKAKPQVTFTKDIAPILQRSCQTCHRPNSLAPMSLLTYEDARPYAASIKRRTSDPQQAGHDAAVVHRKGHRHSALQERHLAERRGGREDRAVGRQRRAAAAIRPTCRRRCKFADAKAWTIGTPDLVVKTPPVSVKAVQPGLVGQRRLRATPASRKIATSRRLRSRKSTITQGKGASANTVGGLFIFHHAHHDASKRPAAPAASPRRRMAGSRSRPQRRRVQSRGRKTAARRIARRVSATCTCTRTARTRPVISRSRSSSTRRTTSRR